MKKTLSTFIALSLMTQAAALAQPAPGDSTAAEIKLDYLITEDFTRFERMIREESMSLDISSRYRLYLNHQLSDTYAASFLNVIPGGGIGSFTMGDTAGGWTLLGGEIAAGLLIGFGSISGDRGLNSLLTGLATLLFAGFRVYGMYRPLQYSSEYNLRLKRNLHLLIEPETSQQSLLTSPAISLSWGF